MSHPSTHTPSPVICPSLPLLRPVSLSGLPGLLSSYHPSSHHASSPHFLSLLSLPHTMLPLLSVERAACMPNQVIHKYRTNVCHYTFTAMTKAGPFCPQKVCPLATWDHSPLRLHTLHLSFTGVNILPINIHWSVFEGCIVCLHLCFQNPKSAFPCAPPRPTSGVDAKPFSAVRASLYIFVLAETRWRIFAENQITNSIALKQMRVTQATSHEKEGTRNMTTECHV